MDQNVHNGGAAPSHRRPIASRELAVFRHMAAGLARAGVSANAVSLGGLVCGVAAGTMLWATGQGEASLAERAWWFGAAVIVQGRLLANMLDGMVAGLAGTTSRIGELYNELPDRISDSAVLIGFGYAEGGNPELGYLGACLAMATAYIRCVGRTLGTGSDFRGPMAKQQRMLAVTAVAVYLAAAPQEWRPQWRFAEGQFGLAGAALAVICVGCVLTCVRRVWFIVARIRGTSA